MNDVIRNFDELPNSAVVRLAIVCRLLPLSKSTILRKVKAGELTRVKLGERATGYKVAEIRAILAGDAK